MPIDEDFLNAEFFKFVNKLNRFLKSEHQELLYFKYEKSGFVEIGIWNETSHTGNYIYTSIVKGGASNEGINSLSED